MIPILILMVSGLVVADERVAGGAGGRTDRIIDAREVLAIQSEPEDKTTGRYDWGPSVMRDGEVYRMWWTRLGGGNQRRFPYATTQPDGQRIEFTYPDWGDRVYYAESRDGRRWPISGSDYAGPIDEFGPDSAGPMMVLAPAESDEEINHLACPSVIKVAGTYYMYYEAPSEYIASRGPDGRLIVGTEYHGQVFVAMSKDGKRWRKHPDDARPRPIVRAPEDNKRPGRQRYGLGQPSVFYRGGRFVMHYVDSCTAPGDFIVRIEADNPFFESPRVFRRSLREFASAAQVPDGGVARFAQTDVKHLGSTLYLLRPAYGTGNLGLLASRTGVFAADANARTPTEVFPQIRVPDPRGAAYKERLFPRFLTDPQGQILVEDGHIVMYYSSGLGFKEYAYTWDIHRCELRLEDHEAARRDTGPS